MKRKKEEESEPSAPFWMITYGDMVTLILTFFILIVSYSTIQLEKFQGALASFKGALGIFAGHESPQRRAYINFDQTLSTQRVDLFERASILEKFLAEANLSQAVEVEIVKEGILIRLGDQVLFDLGKADIKRQALPVLAAIAELVRGNFKPIYVEGHTDNIPIHTDQFPSNWELSIARAFSVVKHFYEVHGIPEEYLAAVGHGEHRPRLPNTTPENRAKNRRVEIFIKWD